MKRQEVIEVVTPEFLEKVFNSRAFNFGLAKVIRITRKTGYEAGFGVAKRVGSDEVIYTSNIVVGDGNTLNRRIALARAKENYKQITGETPKLHTKKGREQFRGFCKEFNEEYEVPYPLPIKRSWNLEVETGNIHEFYGLIGVHTHPSGLCSPSKADLAYLNSLRESYQGPEDIFPRTIGVIAGVEKRKRKWGVPLSFIQERGEIPLGDLEILEGKEETSRKYGFLQQGRMLEAIFGRATDPQAGNQPEDAYNFASSYFDVGERKIDFNRFVPAYPMRLEDFAFKCRELNPGHFEGLDWGKYE